MASHATGRDRTSASKSTRAMRCSGIRSPRWPSSYLSCFRYGVRPALKLGALVAVCAAPFVLGWLAYDYRWFSAQPSNYGELISPRPIDGTLMPLRGKWVLLTADTAACPAACERKLYIVRQVRKA